MISTLAEYYTTGVETEEYRTQFHNMKMGNKGHVNETFPEFTARFRSLAAMGQITKDSWFYQMWDKITPQLRSASTASFHLWKQDFNTMVTSLTSIDLIRRQNYERNVAASSRTNPLSGPSTANISSSQKTSPKLHRTASPATSTSRPLKSPKLLMDRPRPSPSPARPSTANPTSNACFFCGKTGHYKSQCPDLPAIRTMIQEVDSTPTEIEELEDSLDETKEDTNTELISEGN